MDDDFWPFIKSAVFFLGVLVFALNLSCENSDRNGLKSKPNSPPVITFLKILPEKPNFGSELNVMVQSQDPDHDPIMYRYQWMRNDEEMIGEDRNTLKSGIFKKGDLIRVKVTPSDGKTGGKTLLSTPVKIFNSPPVIKEIRIEPKIAYANNDLKAFLKGDDADGDSINYIYRWEKNGVVLNEERSEFLERGKFKRGDSITVTVTPDDMESLGRHRKSDSITIFNGSPIFLSLPPTSAEGTKYLYQVQANDPDNDSLTYTLKSGPKGMEIEKNTGLIQWGIQEEDKGRKQPVEIEVSDSEGAKSFQRYTLSIEFR